MQKVSKNMMIIHEMINTASPLPGAFQLGKGSTDSVYVAEIYGFPTSDLFELGTEQILPHWN